VAPLADAVSALEQLGFAGDAARAVLSQGRALLRAGLRSRASEAFADARRRFAAIGAPLWEARAIEELERVAPGRASGALTPAERKVADLIARGMRNREIGRSLYMSVGTVEAHLTRIYRKLGIRGRSELARLVTQGRLG
jgi:DNA-binding CsgD family transcriptional regulator